MEQILKKIIKKRDITMEVSQEAMQMMVNDITSEINGLTKIALKVRNTRTIMPDDVDIACNLYYGRDRWKNMEEYNDRL